MTGGVAGATMGHTADGGQCETGTAQPTHDRPPDHDHGGRPIAPTMEGSCVDASRTDLGHERGVSAATRARTVAGRPATPHAPKTCDHLSVRPSQGRTPRVAARKVTGHPPTESHLPPRSIAQARRRHMRHYASVGPVEQACAGPLGQRPLSVARTAADAVLSRAMPRCARPLAANGHARPTSGMAGPAQAHVAAGTARRRTGHPTTERAGGPRQRTPTHAGRRHRGGARPRRAGAPA